MVRSISIAAPRLDRAATDGWWPGWLTVVGQQLLQLGRAERQERDEESDRADQCDDAGPSREDTASQR